tara:strand:+ start:651 stop:812 length:162 start_codon:yes stop_codon:yes gene_type:complete
VNLFSLDKNFGLKNISNLPDMAILLNNQFKNSSEIKTIPSGVKMAFFGLLLNK